MSAADSVMITYQIYTAFSAFRNKASTQKVGIETSDVLDEQIVRLVGTQQHPYVLFH